MASQFPEWFLKNKARTNRELDRARTNGKRRTQRRLDKFVEDLEDKVSMSQQAAPAPAQSAPEADVPADVPVAQNPADTVSVDEPAQEEPANPADTVSAETPKEGEK